VFVARYVSTMGPLYIGQIICRMKMPLDFRELNFLFLSGIVRGSIAFALVLKLSGDLPNREIIVTTALMIVVTTTLVIGSAMPFIARIFLYSGPLQIAESPSRLIPESPDQLKEKELKLLSHSNSEYEQF